MPFPSRSRTALLAIALLLASLLVALAGASFLRRVEGFQPLGFSARAQGASWLVERAGEAAALQPGDRLLLVDGRQPGPSETELRRLLRTAPTASLLVQRGEALLELDYARPPVDVDWPYLVVVLVGLLYLFVGGYTLLRDRGGVAALFHLWCLASAAVYLLSPVPPFDLLGRAVFAVEELARVSLPALTLHLFLLFPAPLVWLERRPRLPLFLYLPSALLLAAQLDLALAGGLLLAPRRETLLALERLELYWLVAGGLLGVALLLARLRRHPSWEQNRQLTWIAVGVSAGYIPFVLLYVLPLAVAIRPPELLAVAAVLPLACVPLAFAWAILRYKLWDIGVIVRDALATTVTVLLGVVAFSLVQLLASRGVPPSLAAARPLITFAAGIAIASLVLPTRRSIGEVIERWQYRGTFRKRQALSRLGRELLHERQLERLADALLRSLEEALGLERLNLYLRQGERLVAARSEPGMPTRLTIDALGSALWTQDAVELAEEPLPQPEPGAREQLVAAGLRYAFPLTVRGSVLGLVVTGYRDGEQPLNSDDLELVRSLLDQSALAIENAQLMGQLQDRLAEVTRLERHTQGIIDSSPAGIAVLDAAQRVVSANSAFAELVGRPTASLVGTPIDSVLPAEALPPVGELAETVLGGEAGTLRHVQLSIAPLGASEQAILLLQDVSARVAMENALKEKERLAALGMLAAGVAHEVNTPITGISSYAQMLIADTPSEDPRYLLLKKVEKQTFRAARIVSNLLEFARDRARQQAPLTLQPLLREAVQMLEERIAEAAVTVGWHLPSEPVEVVGNEGELQQVLTNLIVNAVDAMAPQGGGRLSLELGGDESTVRLAVVDNGPGIAPELLEQVFQPFFSTKLARGGTGLGLTISYNIIRRHGGSLRASSQPGEGSRFVIELPRYLRSTAS